MTPTHAPCLTFQSFNLLDERVVVHAQRRSSRLWGCPGLCDAHHEDSVQTKDEFSVLGFRFKVLGFRFGVSGLRLEV